jgi:hypothetical protein
MRQLRDEVEKAKSVDRIFDWLNDVENPEDRATVTTRPDSGIHSGSQTRFASQRSASMPRMQFIDHRPAQIGSSQVEQPPMNEVSMNIGRNKSVRAGEFPPFRGIPGQFRSVQQQSASPKHVNRQGTFARFHRHEPALSRSNVAQE